MDIKRTHGVTYKVNNFDFADLRSSSFFSRKDAAEFCGVTVQTIKNWEKKAPLMALRLFAIISRGFLPDNDPVWARMSIDRKGHLYTEDGRPVKAGDINGIYYQRQLIRYYQVEIRVLKEKNTELNDRLSYNDFLSNSSNDGEFI